MDEIWRTRLFYQQATTVMLAIHRYERVHGRRPARLRDLVPDFLTEVPADPWDGAPLRWDPAGEGLIYGLGEDWTDNPAAAFPVADRNTTSWGNSPSCPALRLTLPPP